MRELLEVGESYGVGCREDGVLVELEVAGQPVPQVVGHLVRDHEPHALAEPAALELVLYGLQEVRGLVFLDHEVRVARDLEDVAGHDLLAGEELVQVRRDDLLDPHEPHLGPLVGPRSSSGSRMKRSIVVGTFMRAITRLPPSSITTSTLSERLEMCGKGWAGSMASGVSIGSMSLTNVSLSSRSLGGADLVVGHHAYAHLFQGWHELPVQYPAPLLEELLRVVVDAQELLLWRHPVGDGVRQLRGDLLLQPRDPDHEELVEVGLGDGDEPHPLQERVPLVAGLLQDPVVEPEPRELAVYVQRRV